jgi:hypothetical protein
MRYFFSRVDFILFGQVQVHEGAHQSFRSVLASFYVECGAVNQLKQQAIVHVGFF